MRASTVFAALGALLVASAAQAAVVLSDNFDDGDTAGWTHSTNFPGSAGTSGIESTNTKGYGNDGGSASPDPADFALRTYLVPTGFTGPVFSNVYSRATTTFNLAVGGNYELTLEARSRNCGGCTMYYEVFVDGSTVWDHNSSGAGEVLAFESRSFTLSGLAVGSHTLTLGLFSTGAQSGDFQAFFDNVRIASLDGSVGEPASLAVVCAALMALGGLSRRRLGDPSRA